MYTVVKLVAADCIIGSHYAVLWRMRSIFPESGGSQRSNLIVGNFEAKAVHCDSSLLETCNTILTRKFSPLRCKSHCVTHGKLYLATGVQLLHECYSTVVESFNLKVFFQIQMFGIPH